MSRIVHKRSQTNRLSTQFAIEDGEAKDERTAPGSTHEETMPGPVDTAPETTIDSSRVTEPGPAVSPSTAVHETEPGPAVEDRAEDTRGEATVIDDVYVRPYKGTSRPPDILPYFWNRATPKQRRQAIAEYEALLASRDVNVGRPTTVSGASSSSNAPADVASCPALPRKDGPCGLHSARIQEFEPPFLGCIARKVGKKEFSVVLEAKAAMD